MTHEEIVKKLVGSITPYGASDIDERRMENLKVMCELVSGLVEDIRFTAQYKDRHEHSIKIMGEYADNFLKELNN